MLDQPHSKHAPKHTKHTPPFQKFENRYITATGAKRASVALNNPSMLWFNTGSLCNIECVNCYIKSSPKNDHLAYISTSDVIDFLDQIDRYHWPISTIGFTGGEPFMNPNITAILQTTLERGYKVLVLTNAMRPLMRPKIKRALVDLQHRFLQQITFRVSLDHYDADKNDAIRGKGSFDCAIAGLVWLNEQGFKLAIAGRSLWNESEAHARAHYGAFYQKHKLRIDAYDPMQTVIFPEMDNNNTDSPEITDACWRVLGKSPNSVMCAQTRMVLKRKNAAKPTVVPCTLLYESTDFDMGTTLKQAESKVWLNHSYCSQFCVLGGASCGGQSDSSKG